MLWINRDASRSRGVVEQLEANFGKMTSPDYDKPGIPDPLNLDYYFTLRGDLIVKPIILHNKPANLSNA
jgi:hypothetical protein